MARPLKVWHTALHDRRIRKQVCVIVAATTQKGAAALFSAVEQVSPAQLRTYGGVTGNPEEVAIAMAKPGTVFATKGMNYPRVYEEWRP